MIDETGVPGKPYVGKNGKPRKTKPPKGKTLKAMEADAVVSELFTEERQDAPGIRSEQDRTITRKKVKIGRGWSTAMQQMKAEDMTMQQFVANLTPEELARGQLKAKDGTFRGAPPKWVPAEFHKECIRELMRRGKQIYQESYIDAIETMRQIANSPAVEPAQRIRAAQFVIERIEGKVPDRLEVGVSEPWQEILSGIVADVPADAPMRAFHEAQAAIEGGDEAPDADR